MSFRPGEDAQPFTRESVYDHAPRGSGVYIINSLQTCLYVGESHDIQMRLLEHLADTNGCLMRSMPFSFSFELNDGAQRFARQQELATQLQPLCNEATS